MKILNLVNKYDGNISYLISKFPDGQQNITVYRNDQFNPQIKIEPVIIKARLNNFRDLELISCAVSSLRELGIKEIHLYTPYFLGSRSDRKFQDGGNNYLKHVICPIINSLNFESVTVMDEHSDILEACLNNFKKLDNSALVKRFLLNTYNLEEGFHNKFILVSPDAGANKKIYNLAKQLEYKGEIITCTKSRDVDGKLSNTIVPAKDTGPLCMKDYIIIDDICDGGATFLNIAKELKKLYNCNKIYLIVTHGIFSKGFEELSKYFDKICCTNSYSDILSSKDEDWQAENVEQLNVF